MEAPMLESLFNKVAGLKAWSFIKKRLQHIQQVLKFMKIYFDIMKKKVIKEKYILLNTKLL